MIVGADPKEGKGQRGCKQWPLMKPGNWGLDQLCPYLGPGSYARVAFISDPHFDLYVPASNSIMKILKAKADKFEQGGIDEAYLDISSQAKDFDEPDNLLRR